MSEPLFSTSFLARTVRRRSFFRVVGATAAATTLVLAGCNDDPDPTPVTTANTLNLGSGDSGLLNYAYLLEQLEAAFYQKVVDAFPTDFTADDKAAFVDLRDHEVIHREFLRYALGTTAYDANIGTALVFDFSSFTLTTRAGVYAAARTLEDVGVAAYNGAGKLISEGTNLRLLGKIASVEARHAAFVRDQAQPGSFAASDVVATTGDSAGLDIVKTPVEVAELIAKFLPVTLVATGLPVS
ncbi:ferritin-like domain-containing protein [Hymenobacter gelipurpurascens]|nr:ferritin-like domain-containing protein [Hymenobacter gelipurpurascens]